MTPSGARISSRFFVNEFKSSTLANKLLIEIKSANPWLLIIFFTTLWSKNSLIDSTPFFFASITERYDGSIPNTLCFFFLK